MSEEMSGIPNQNPKDQNGQISFSKGINKKSNKKSSKSAPKTQSGIPKKVANRMARRVAITTGLPTFCGMSVFVVSYLLISRGIADIAPGITLISSALFFLVGLLGLSYGMLSASWDDSPGTLIGLENIRPNIKRMREAFKTQEK